MTLRASADFGGAVFARSPCFPSVELPPCKNCARRSDGDPPLMQHRGTPVIDGAVLARDGICQMFELQPPARAINA
jgi:hypothetical protein